MIAYFVYIATKVLEYEYDLGVKGQGQIFLKSFLVLETQIPRVFLLRVFVFSKSIVYVV